MVSFETGCLTTNVSRTCGYTFNLDPYPAKSRPGHLLMRGQAGKGRQVGTPDGRREAARKAVRQEGRAGRKQCAPSGRAQ